MIRGSLPQPRDFSGETPSERIMGLEAEMIVTSSKGGSTALSNDIIFAANTGEFSAGVSKSGIKNIPITRQINGAQLDKDLNNIVEGATPECLGPRQLANAHVALLMNLQETLATLATLENAEGSKHQQIQLLVRTALLHYSDQDDPTFGMHLGLSTPLTESLDARTRDTRFFVSGMGAAFTWTGVGCLNEVGFQLSQKVSGLAYNDDDLMPVRRWGHRTSPGNKPAHTWTSLKIAQPGPMESYGNLYDRAEWRALDMPHSYWQLFMAAAVGSHTMRLIEQKRHLPKDFFARNTFANIPYAIHRIGRDITLATSFKTEAGTRVTALDIGEMQTEALLKMHNSGKVHLPADEVEALHERVRLNDDLRRSRNGRDTLGYTPLADRLERVGRYKYIARKIGEDALSIHTQQALDMDLRWDRKYPEGPATKYWAKIQQDLYEQNQADIEYLRYNPPPNTRAAAFMHVLEHFKGKSIEDYDWHFILPVREKGSTMIYLPDPYDAKPPSLGHQIRVAMPRRPHSSEMFGAVSNEADNVHPVSGGTNE